MSGIYSLTVSAAKLLRDIIENRPIDGNAWVDRLEAFDGTEADARRAVAILSWHGHAIFVAGVREAFPPKGGGFEVDPRDAGVLYRWGDNAPKGFADRLVNGHGTREDAEAAVRIFDQVGMTRQADGLKLQADFAPMSPELVEAVAEAPALPFGWAPIGDERMGLYRYEGAMVKGFGDNLGEASLSRRWDVDAHPFDVNEEIGRAQLALVGYLRAKAAR